MEENEERNRKGYEEEGRRECSGGGGGEWHGRRLGVVMRGEDTAGGGDSDTVDLLRLPVDQWCEALHRGTCGGAGGGGTDGGGSSGRGGGVGGE